MEIFIKHTRKQKLMAIIIILTFVLTSILAACSKNTLSSKTDEAVVARVNDEVITKGELYDFLVKENGHTALNSLIAMKIVELEAKNQNVKVTEADIQKKVDEIAEQYGGKETFEQFLEMYGQSLDDLKLNIEMNLNVEGLLEPDIDIQEDEMKNYFEENKEKFNEQEQVRARHILVESKSEAEEVRNKLLAGEDFSKLAKDYSTDSSNNEQGGDLGFFARGDMVKEFEDVAFSLEVGNISEPVKTDFGYHIIKVEDHKQAKEANYEDNKVAIREILFEEKLPTVYNAWLQEKFDEYEIEILLGKDK